MELRSDWLVGWLLGNKTIAHGVVSLHLLCFSPLENPQIIASPISSIFKRTSNSSTTRRAAELKRNG